MICSFSFFGRRNFLDPIFRLSNANRQHVQGPGRASVGPCQTGGKEAARFRQSGAEVEPGHFVVDRVQYDMVVTCAVLTARPWLAHPWRWRSVTATTLA
jgi:hypothetical protein